MKATTGTVKERGQPCSRRVKRDGRGDISGDARVLDPRAARRLRLRDAGRRDCLKGVQESRAHRGAAARRPACRAARSTGIVAREVRVTAHEKKVVALLRRLGETQPDDVTIYNVDCGLHSGFSACCIAFFVKVWDPWVLCVATLQAHGETRDQLMMRADPQQLDALISIDRYQDMLGDLRVGYIPCPRCALEEDFVTPRRCRHHLSKRQRSSVRRMLST